jgi:hypothetical protein
MQASSIRRDRDAQIDIDTLAEAEPNTALGKFTFFRLEIHGGRLVPGLAPSI